MNAILASNPFALPSALVDRAAVQKAVETALHTVEKRNTYPMLSHVRLTGDGSTLFVTGTDLDMEIVVAVPAAADIGLDLTMPAHMLKDLLKKAPKADMVAITPPDTDEEQAHVEFDTVDYQVATLDPTDWPSLAGPSHNEARRFTLSGETILAALDAVAFAISNEETRYYLNGAYLCHTPANGVQRYNGHHGYLDVVATDGHRLARQTVEAPEGCEGMPGVILPKKLIYTLQKLWKGKNTPEFVTAEVTDERVRFQFEDTTVTSKVVQGTYPDYHRVTPKHNDKPMSVSVSALREALKALSIIGGKAVKFEIGSDGLTLSMQNAESGRAVTTIDADAEFDGGLEIGFNAKYLDDFLANVNGESETLTLNFSDMAGPALVTCEREGWLGVLMPMRV